MGISVIALLFTPIALVFFRSPWIQQLFPTLLQTPQDGIANARYSVTNEVPGYSLKIVNTTYLDYMMAKLGLFNNQIIVDPKTYRGFPGLQQHYSISKIIFSLVPTVDNPLSVVSSDTALLGKGEYRVNADTLLVRVSINFDELKKNSIATRYSLENAYLLTALYTLRYAIGFVNGLPNENGLLSIKNDVQNNLYDGIFAWPFRIEVK